MKFVAHPDAAPPATNLLFARPDDLSDAHDLTWRERLTSYTLAKENSFGLLAAYQLYDRPIYEQLVAAFGVTNVFILSAGWGLVRADYLLPLYDITFTRSADRYKRRDARENYQDFCQISKNETGPLIFFGGTEYQPLLRKLTDCVQCEKIVYFASAHAPEHPNWKIVRFPQAFTNWHYACAKQFLSEQE